MADVDRWVDDLEVYKNTGILNVSGLNLNTVAQTGVTPGTVTASAMIVPDSSKNLDGLGIKDLRIGATPVHVVDPAQCTVVAAAGASNVSTITVALKDGAGNAMSRVIPFDVYVSDASTGIGISTTAASTGFSVASGGGVRQLTDSITKSLMCVSSATGGCVLSLTDTGKTAYYIVLSLANGIKVSAVLSSGSYGA